MNVIVPTVVKVWFDDYRMRDSDFAETNNDHTWSCDGWHHGDLVQIPQYDTTVTPAREEPVYMIGGAVCNAWTELYVSAVLTSHCDVDLKSDWASFAGAAHFDDDQYGTGSGAFPTRPQQVDKFIDQQITWSYKVPNGSDNWIAINTTTHDIYQSYDQPCGDPAPPAPRRRVSTVCSEAEDETTVEDIADDITDWVAGETNDGFGSMDPDVDPWCYFDSGADPIECDDQAQLACHVLALSGVLGSVVLVRASTDRSNCFDIDDQLCDICFRDEELYLFDGTSVNNFEGCCYVVDNGVSILYALWSASPGVKKAKETDVTNNPPYNLNAAALSMLNELTGMSQVWIDQLTRLIKHYNVPKPPTN